ncbi:MANSC domain containing protein 1 [Dissostichus eleginoides]|uniref:MANSC domain containing protein 1 n=1 Tax=Dissostichus eleginoides TaxID=100907 RepID=A0AAD9CPL9_DISEL|nr:MANSC domain containing protein 1 [Dissostichus eleginoides]
MTPPPSSSSPTLLLVMVTSLMTSLVTSQALDPETCYSRQHQSAIVNVRQAMTNPSTAMDARAVTSERDCVLSCCSEEVKPGAKCNMAVFNGNKPAGEDNCFLFHCEVEQDCPLMKAQDNINTYDIYKGLIHPTTLRTSTTTTTTTEPTTITITTTPAPTTPPTTQPTTTQSTTTTTTTTPPTTTTTTLAPTTPPTTTMTTPPLPPFIILATMAPVPPETATTTTTTTTTTSPTTTTTTTIAMKKPNKPANLVVVAPKDAVQSDRALQDSGSHGALRSGVVAFMVLGLAVLTLALAVGGRKAMESFDRRHYTRLELNDLHYEV